MRGGAGGGGVHQWSKFPAQRASNAANVSIWWRHHGSEWYSWYPYLKFLSSRWKVRSIVRGWLQYVNFQSIDPFRQWSKNIKKMMLFLERTCFWKKRGFSMHNHVRHTQFHVQVLIWYTLIQSCRSHACESLIKFQSVKLSTCIYMEPLYKDRDILREWTLN